MPDTWEYPWYAAWDLAFHCIAMALIDSEFAKKQLLLMLHERYMHPSGQLPAYEWAFSDVNPPVHGWVAWRIYMQEKERTGKGDTQFLERMFNKLMLNFTWWVNRKDAEDNNVFEGGFLGLDNIGVFDRNTPLPDGAVLEQSDGTAWMGMFAAILLAMALELSRTDPTYEDMAAKLAEHYMYIADAIYGGERTGLGLWNEEDGFFYDKISTTDGQQIPLKVRSLVGLIATPGHGDLSNRDRGSLYGGTHELVCGEPSLYATPDSALAGHTHERLVERCHDARHGAWR